MKFVKGRRNPVMNRCRKGKAETFSPVNITRESPASGCGPAALLAGLLVLFLSSSSLSSSVPIVKNGRARAVVVNARTPSPVASYATEELIRHLEKATGVSLPTAAENEDVSGYPVRIYVGETEAARRAGIKSDELGPDAFILRVLNGDIFVLGKESARTPRRDRHTSDKYILEEGDDAPSAPLSERNPYSGTMFGVYEILERFAGVLWLWPGELGTYVPRTDTVIIDKVDEAHEPALRFHRYRWSRLHRSFKNAEVKRLSFSDDGFWNYREDLRVYVRRHRMGYTEVKPTIGHYFGGWWHRYGEKHPEWFKLNKYGERGPDRDHPAHDPEHVHVGMCVSNPELHEYIVEKAWDGGNLLRLGEVDSSPFCHCQECLSWDGPQPEDAARYVTTGRYARFWKTIHKMAAEKNPDVVVSTFLYTHYFPAPTEDIELNENIYGEFVPWGGGNTIFFPTSDDRLEWQREQWHGWAETGITMGYRPNHTLAGYAMPHINTRQGGEFMRFAYKHGMIGADFDSLIGQWAVRGPEHYMYFRLLADPARSVEQIRDEYFSAFGPAAEHVEKYFDFWEKYNHVLYERSLWNDMWRYPQNAPRQYPPPVFTPAREILEDALEAAMTHPLSEFAERVEFLQAGLEHSRLSVELVRKLLDNHPGAGNKLRELIAFRRAHEHMYIADFVWLGRLENAELGSQLNSLFND